MEKVVFLDTEFSGLGQECPRLISLALVSEGEGDHLYIETPVKTWRDQATPWVVENVAPHLRGGSAVVETAGILERLAKWLQGQGQVAIVSDCPEFDFAFLQSFLDPWPNGVAREPIMFGTRSLGEGHRQLLEVARASAFSAEMPEHNALADALALKRMWFAARTLCPRHF